MGSENSKPSDCVDEPWWSIENEYFTFQQPDLRELLKNDNDDIQYPTVREKILAKLRNRQYSYSVCISDCEDFDGAQLTTTSAPRSVSESEASTRLDSTSLKDDENGSFTGVREQQTLEEFQEELRLKRIARQTTINNLRIEINSLRQQLIEEQKKNRLLQKELKIRNHNSTNEEEEEENSEDEPSKIEKNDVAIECRLEARDTETQTDAFVPNASLSLSSFCEVTRSPSDHQQINLKAQLAELQLALQLANADNLSLTTELGVVRKQVASLKEVIACSRQMIDVREEQVQQLKIKLQQIEESLADRELKIMSDNLRQEYDRQLANIRNLRQLYEERARVSAAERENLLRQISIKKDELAVEVLKVRKLELHLATAETELANTKEELKLANDERKALHSENKQLQEEMAVINKLFSQMLTGFNGANNLDIDHLTLMLEENRTLLNEMVVEEKNSEGACLPKVLFDILKQVKQDEKAQIEVNEEHGPKQKENTENIGGKNKMSENVNGTTLASSQEIINNLSKVWKVLNELLNHHKVEQVQFQENGQSEECYKSVQTPTDGLKPEISVSKTYMKLKDLILEKKFLLKERKKLKTLNSHLEHRLDKQEARLSVVSLELTKTWNLVGKMQRQHRQLHTNEQILRYHLQQKKRLLNELKEELEYCRRKWAAARAKNAESQLQCEDMRREFANRKLQDASVESGYSDGAGSSSDEEPVSSTSKDSKNKKFFPLLPRQIERTHSTSPVQLGFREILPRRTSAPPASENYLSELLDTTDEITSCKPLEQSIALTSTEPDQAIAKTTLPPTTSRIAVEPINGNRNRGAIPKQNVQSVMLSRSRRQDKNHNKTVDDDSETLEEMFRRLNNETTENKVDQFKLSEKEVLQLEEQWKILSDQNKRTAPEILKFQIIKFQEMVRSVLNNKILVDSSKAVSNEDYFVRLKFLLKESQRLLNIIEEKEKEVDLIMENRSERLRKLEEESKRIITKLTRHSHRGSRMNSRIDALHLKYGSPESKMDEEEQMEFCASGIIKNEEGTSVRLTSNEESYLSRREERLKRLEWDSQDILKKLAGSRNRGSELINKLDKIHLGAKNKCLPESTNESENENKENKTKGDNGEIHEKNESEDDSTRK